MIGADNILTPEDFEELPRPMSRLIFDVENWVIQRVAADLARTGQLSATSEYRLSLLKDIRQFNTDYKKKIAKLAELTLEQVEDIFTEAAKRAYHYDEDLFTKTGIEFVPFEKNSYLQQITRAAIKQTNGEIKNLTRTTALKMIDQVSKKPVPIPKFFKQTLDRTTMNVAMGVESYDEAIRRTIKDMVMGVPQPDGTRMNGGIVVVRYEGENRRPVNRSVEAVCRMAVLTGVAQLSAKVSVHNMELLGNTHLLVSGHNGARTDGSKGISDHQFWQNKVYKVSDEDRKKMIKGLI